MDKRYETKYYPNLEGNGLIPFYNPYSGLYGYADKYNTVIIKATFSEISEFKNGFARVGIKERLFGVSYVVKYIIIDIKGNKIKDARSNEFIRDSTNAVYRKL